MGENALDYLVVILESCFEALYCLCGDYTIIKLVPANYCLHTKNEFLNGSVVEFGTLKHFELFVTLFSTNICRLEILKLSSFYLSLGSLWNIASIYSRYRTFHDFKHVNQSVYFTGFFECW